MRHCALKIGHLGLLVNKLSLYVDKGALLKLHTEPGLTSLACKWRLLVVVLLLHTALKIARHVAIRLHLDKLRVPQYPPSLKYVDHLLLQSERMLMRLYYYVLLYHSVLDTGLYFVIITVSNVLLQVTQQVPGVQLGVPHRAATNSDNHPKIKAYQQPTNQHYEYKRV